jgi:predicted metal-binding membrane protein
MGGMAMAGGASMSMSTWARLPGESWLGTAAAFELGWLVMMAAMMAPSIAPTLWRYRRVLTTAGVARASRSMALLAAGYLTTWGALGAAVYPAGVALAATARRWPPLVRAEPTLVGLVVLAASALQLSAWKARALACCRAAADRRAMVPAGAVRAWRHGLRLGSHCIRSCAGATAVLLAVGLMDLRAMIVVTAAVTLERLAPRGERVARMVGGIGVCAGTVLVAWAVVRG